MSWLGAELFVWGPTICSLARPSSSTLRKHSLVFAHTTQIHVRFVPCSIVEMSGAFETAAGAFAVVGVADVVVRTGQDLYRFLRDFSDAPEEVKRLGECIRDAALLVDGLRNCTQATVSAGIRSSVQAAVRALDRELQSLKLLVAKFKGAKTAWSRIKYVLDENKVAKALANLERSKTLLVNALTIIYG